MDYIEDLVREKIADEIRYLELPPKWRTDQVIEYIVRKIEKNNG